MDTEVKGLESAFLNSWDSWDMGGSCGDLIFSSDSEKGLDLTDYAKEILVDATTDSPFYAMLLSNGNSVVEFIREDQTSVEFKIALRVV